MDEKKRSANPPDAVGVEFHFTDSQTSLPPTRHELDESTSQQWFQDHPKAEDKVQYKLLALRIDRRDRHKEDSFSVPFNAETVEHAFWKSEVYHNFTLNPAGGASALMDDSSHRFLLQTPRDNGPFCSLAMSKRGNTVKGIYVYDHDDFEPARIGNGEVSYSGWRSNGMQIITFPSAFARAHSKYVSANLAATIRQIEAVEIALAQSTGVDFGALSLSLHNCNTALIDMDRRSRFEQAVVSAVETVVGKLNGAANVPWPHVASVQSAINARAFDFESLPRRIQDARATISSLIQQRNEIMNLEIAEASRRMAEIAVSDNASMKTIAIMTMIFLPGTAIASFFSMDMFDWTASDGSQIASKWLWVYFVVSVPLTGMVIAFWWIWANRTANRTFRLRWNHGSSAMEGFEDIELADQPEGTRSSPQTSNSDPDKRMQAD